MDMDSMVRWLFDRKDLKNLRKRFDNKFQIFTLTDFQPL